MTSPSVLRGRRRIGLLAVAVAVCALLVVASLYESGAILPRPTGATGGFNYLQPFPATWGTGWNSTAIQANLDRAVELGGGLVRVFFVQNSYYFVNNTCQAQYFDHLSEFLSWAGARGLKAVVNLGISVDASNVTASEASFSCFASRYSGDHRVQMWELTNEPDQSDHWDADFWAKLKTVYDYVKAQDPSHDVTVAIAYASNMAWLCQNVLIPDVPQYHEYSPWGGLDQNSSLVDKVRGDIGGAYQACGRHPVLIGETGFPSAPSACGLPTGCSDALQKGYLNLVLQAAKESCGEVSGVLIWTLTDFPQELGTQGHYGIFAVVDGTFTQKPAAGTVESYFSGGFGSC